MITTSGPDITTCRVPNEPPGRARAARRDAAPRPSTRTSRRVSVGARPDVRRATKAIGPAHSMSGWLPCRSLNTTADNLSADLSVHAVAHAAQWRWSRRPSLRLPRLSAHRRNMRALWAKLLEKAFGSQFADTDEMSVEHT